MAQIVGTSGADTLTGTPEDDVIIGRGGADALRGGLGRDVFRYEAATDSSPDAYDIIFDIAGSIPATDTIDLTAVRPTAISVVQDAGSTFLFVTTPTGPMTIGVAGGFFRGDYLTTGPTPLGLFVVGVGGAFTLEGGAGNDRIVGTAGNNRILGGRGADVLTGGGGVDRFEIAVAESLASAPDRITDFQPTIDRLELSSASPITAWTLQFIGADAALLIITDTAAARIDFTGGFSPADISYDRPAPRLQVVGSADRNIVTLGETVADVSGGGGDDLVAGSTGMDVLRGGDGNDTLESGWSLLREIRVGLGGGSLVGYQPGDGGRNVVEGGSGNDQLSGGTNDRLDGGAGDDRITLGVAAEIGLALPAGSPLATSVTALGGDGVDTFLVRGSASLIDGGDGADRISISRGTGNTVVTGGGADVISASEEAGGAYRATITDFTTGVDRIELSGSLDVSIVRSGGATYLFAQRVVTAVPSRPVVEQVSLGSLTDINASDLINLRAGVYMVGDVGADALIGSALGDVITAGSGRDVITGGGGGDVLYGGADADRFVYRTASDSALNGADTIFDFQSGVDQLDLTGVRRGATDRFGVAQAGGASFLFVDLGGDGVNDMLIQLTNVSLQSADILW